MFKVEFFTRIAAVAATLSLAGQAAAQTLPIIDDFTTGPMSSQFNGAKQTGNLFKSATQRGSHILGGTRTTFFFLNQAANPYRQDANIQVTPGNANAPASFLLSSGYYADAVPYLVYGIVDGIGAKPLHVDLTQYDRIRVTFGPVSGGIQSDIEIWAGTAESILGCGVLQSETPQTVDYPLANFSGDANLAAVTGILFETEEGGVYGGYNYGVTSIAMVAPGAPAGDVTCTAAPPARSAARP